jgi:RNA polymerase sigma factor (sigma-70 family)
MTAVPDWEMTSDAELAGAAAAGDRAAFAGIYDRYADRLHDFCIGMLRDREAAADCVQEVFCTAAVQLAKLREPDKLRPWLYAIARNEALRCIRLRGRENVSDELPEAESFDAGPDTLAARTELAALVAAAAGGLSDRDRSVLELSYRHGLDGPELAEALGVSTGNATKLVSRLRETIERSLGALLVARRVQRNPRNCPELGAILTDWDGHFSVLMRKRIARHIDSCSTCERSRRDLVNPAALLGAAPVLVAAPWWLRGQTLSNVQLTAADFAMTADTTHSSSESAGSGYRQGGATHGAAGSGAADSRSHRIKAAAVMVGIVIVALGATVMWLQHQKTSVAPSDVTVTTPAPSRASTPPPAATEPQTQPPALPPQPSNPIPGPSMPANGPVPGPTMPPSQAPVPIITPTPGHPVPTPTLAPPTQPTRTSVTREGPPGGTTTSVPTRTPVTTIPPRTFFPPRTPTSQQGAPPRPPRGPV